MAPGRKFLQDPQGHRLGERRSCALSSRKSRSNQDRALDAIRAFCEQWFGIDHTVTWQLAHDRWQAAVRDPNDEIVAVAYGSPAGLLESLARQVRSASR